MRRREFITLLSGAAAWPIAARAQQPKRIGVLMNGVATDEVIRSYVTAFTQQLRRLGWIEGQNLQIEYRWNEGDAALARTYAAELVGLPLDVLVASSSTNLNALQRLSPPAPIVFLQVSDPVEQGYVLNMAHPGGNITGFTSYEFAIGGKWVDLLKQLVPTITRVGIAFHPATTPQSKFFIDSIETAGPKFSVNTVPTPIHSVAEIESVIADFSRQPHGGLIFPTGAFITVHRKQIAEVAARYRVPAVYSGRTLVLSGGLMRYGAEYEDQFRQAGVYVDRILKGTKAGDLPVQTPTKFSLGINLKAARSLEIEVPLSLLLIAEEQIE
jgi:putative ABC transport system substrate-binding protein